MRAKILWTDDRIAILTQLWADGATAVAIAASLGGLSRSAVLGKIFRLRRCVRGEDAATQARRKPPALARRRRRRRPRASPKSPRIKAKQPRPRGLGLLELSNETCRFPHGEPGQPGFFFCGAPDADLEAGRPYCARHARRAYTSAANSAAADGEPVIAVRNSPSISPFDSPYRYVSRAPVRHPAARWR